MATQDPYPVLTTVTWTGGGSPFGQGRGALVTALSLLTIEPHQGISLSCPPRICSCSSLSPKLGSSGCLALGFVVDHRTLELTKERRGCVG